MENIDLNELTYRNFDSICRFCLTRNLTLKPIFHEFLDDEDEFDEWDDEYIENLKNKVTVPEFVSSFTNLTIIMTDDYPKFMCSKCSKLIEQFLKFRQNCIDAFDTLEKINATYRNKIPNQQLHDTRKLDVESPDVTTELDVESPDIKPNLLHGFPEEYNLNSDNKLFDVKVEPKNEESLENIEEEVEELIDFEHHSQSQTGNKSISKTIESSENVVEYNSGEKTKSKETNPKDKTKSKKQKSVRVGPRNSGFCEICGENKQQLYEHLKMHKNERKYICRFCDKSFNVKAYLDRHLEIHFDQKRYKCHLCEKGFNDTTSLRVHLVVHSGEKNYICSICERAFNHPSSLRRHILTHTQERRFNCNVCEKKFSLSATLRKHMRIHTGERPFRCKFCDKRFSIDSNCLVHMRTVHREDYYKMKHPDNDN